MVSFSAQGMIERILHVGKGLTALSDLSFRWACPLHCSSSVLPWLFLGILLGFLLAFLLGLLLAFSVLKVFRPSVEVAGGGPFAEAGVVRPAHLSKRLRLAGYLE